MWRSTSCLNQTNLTYSVLRFQPPFHCAVLSLPTTLPFSLSLSSSLLCPLSPRVSLPSTLVLLTSPLSCYSPFAPSYPCRHCCPLQSYQQFIDDIMLDEADVQSVVIDRKQRGEEFGHLKTCVAEWWLQCSYCRFHAATLLLQMLGWLARESGMHHSTLPKAITPP